MPRKPNPEYSIDGESIPSIIRGNLREEPHKRLNSH